MRLHLYHAATKKNIEPKLERKDQTLLKHNVLGELKKSY